MRLSPRHGFAYVWVLSNVYFVMGRYDDAIVTLKEVVQRNPASSPGRLLLIAIYGLLDRIDDAQWEVDEILAEHPDFSIAEEKKRSRFQKPEDLERYIRGLRKAGLPE
jgi:adenylate cyclase